MSNPAKVFVNARFLTEPVTGLQRWGREVMLALDEMLADGAIDPERYQFRLLVPEEPRDAPAYRHLKVVVAGPLRSHLWEQIVLPRRARGGFLLNVKNTAPVRHRHMGVVIHDLQVYAQPDMHTGLFRRVYRWILPRAARRARVLMAVSHSTAREIEKYLGISQFSVVVTEEGHEHVLREPADESILDRHVLPRGGYLLAVSSLNPNKNFPAILRAMRRAEIDLPLVIAGGANPRVFEGAGAHDLPGDAVYVGRAADAELRALYENALGFCFPSFHEGWGLPAGEAMLLGCPVVASETSSVPEVCGAAAIYCDPGDDASIAKALRRLVEDGPLRQELAALGRARAQKFTWRATAEKVWAAIRPHVDAAAKDS